MICPICKKEAKQIPHYNGPHLALVDMDGDGYYAGYFEGPMSMYGCGTSVTHLFWVTEDVAKKYDKEFQPGLCEAPD